MTLTFALDKDVRVIVEKFLSDGVPADVASLYQSIQRSNSSLKRRPKKILEASIERVLDFLGTTDDKNDSEAELDTLQEPFPDTNSMNRSLRANLSQPRPVEDTPMSEASPRRRMITGEAMPKRQKTTAVVPASPSPVLLQDIGGVDEVVGQLEQLVAPLKAPEMFISMGLAVPSGVLLHGPPGCGKTTIANALANELGVPFIQMPGPSVVANMSGDSEKNIRAKFDEAKSNAPCLLFIDEIDAIAPKREASLSQMEKRIVVQLLASMDELGKDLTKPVIVLAATNQPDSLDPALRRGGRFETEINIGVPNEDARAAILTALTMKTPLTPDVDFTVIARQTAGFVGADLEHLVRSAGSWQMAARFDALRSQVKLNDDAEPRFRPSGRKSIDRLRQLNLRLESKDMPNPEGHEDVMLSMEAFAAVLPTIVPSSKREGFATIPDVSWHNVGALSDIRQELEMAIVQPIIDPQRFKQLGLVPANGVLLWGPPGCGKTLLAKAVAAESKANFISVKGPELLNKYLGESEASVRRLFNRARSSVPCIIFFDELDALTPRRDSSASEASARVVNTLLTELDGLNDRAGIFVVAATNRPDIIDEAMLRPGRLETMLFVGLPNAQERVEILRAILRGKNIDMELADIAASSACEGLTGADLGLLWTNAARHALKRCANAVTQEDLEYATTVTTRSVREMGKYDRMREKLARRG